MKLYAWQPKGHGEQSFFVMAESLEAAKEAVEKEIQRLKSEPEGYFHDSDFDGWGSDYYSLTVAEVNQVILNDND